MSKPTTTNPGGQEVIQLKKRHPFNNSGMLLCPPVPEIALSLSAHCTTSCTLSGCGVVTNRNDQNHGECFSIHLAITATLKERLTPMVTGRRLGTRYGARIPVVDGPDQLWVVLKLKNVIKSLFNLMKMTD